MSHTCSTHPTCMTHEHNKQNTTYGIRSCVYTCVTVRHMHVTCYSPSWHTCVKYNTSVYQKYWARLFCLLQSLYKQYSLSHLNPKIKTWLATNIKSVHIILTTCIWHAYTYVRIIYMYKAIHIHNLHLLSSFQVVYRIRHEHPQQDHGRFNISACFNNFLQSCLQDAM